jgi:hypothetical protein
MQRFEANISCNGVAESTRLTSCTKFIAFEYHHFREFVKNGVVKLYLIVTRGQQAYISTKLFDDNQFKYVRSLFFLW